jgi:hypothetical protein
MSKFQVRGCCCGIPFGCGVLVIVLFAALLWKLAMPGHLWPSGLGRTLALLAVPGLVFALIAGSGVRRR